VLNNNPAAVNEQNPAGILPLQKNLGLKEEGGREGFLLS